MECTAAYCEIEMMVYRPLLTNEKADPTFWDTQYENGKYYTYAGSYRVFDSVATTTPKAKGTSRYGYNFLLNKRHYVPSGAPGDRIKDHPKK